MSVYVFCPSSGDDDFGPIMYCVLRVIRSSSHSSDLRAWNSMVGLVRFMIPFLKASESVMNSFPFSVVKELT